MRSLKDFISHKKESIHQPILLDDKTVFFFFRKIIRGEYGIRGENELTPVAFSNGRLSVKASNPLYSNELWIHREHILSRMNQEIGEGSIKEIDLVRYNPQ